MRAASHGDGSGFRADLKRHDYIARGLMAMGVRDSLAPASL